MVKVECPGCQAPYEIDERRIPASGLKMRCPKCGTSVPVAKPGGAAPPAFAPAPAAPAPAPMAPAPAPMALAPAPMALAPAPSGGFGALDGFGDEGTSGGGVDLPAPVMTGGVDLPSFAPRPQAGGFGHPGAPPFAPPFAPAAPAAPKAPSGGGGFGEIDLMSDFSGGASAGGEVDLPAVQPSTPFGAIDLPAARPVQGGLPGAPGFAPSAPAGSDFGAIDLPMVSGAAQGQPGFPNVAQRVPPPPPAAGLPSPAFGAGAQAGLPAPAGGGAGLPALGGQRAGLPALGDNAGLPALGGQAGLPSLGGGGGLPALSGGGLPALSGGGLPAVSGGGLPAVGGGGLPALGGGGLPALGGEGLPSVGGGLPALGGSLPSPGGSLPSLGGQLPSHQGASLPSLGGSLPAGVDAFPTVGGQLPMTSGAGLPAFSGAGLPSVSEAGLPSMTGDGGDGGLIMGVGGEDLEMPLPGGGGLAPTATGTRPRPKADAWDELSGPPKKSNAIRYIAGVLAVVGLGGAALSFAPKIGPFGAYLVSDTLNSKKYAEALATLRKESQASLDGDAITSYATAIQKADAAHVAAPRHDDTAAYGAYLIYEKSLRFGREAGGEAKAKGLLTGVDASKGSNVVAMAKAAEAALAGQVDAAREQARAVAAKAPTDIDALVLVGEIELFGKAPAKAIDAFTKAVTAHKSARTLFGLARAQMAADKLSEAEATAKSVLEIAPNHVGARIMLGSIAGDAGNREGEALDLLQKVVRDPTIRAQASDAELVDAYTLLGKLHLAATRLSQAEEAFAAALKLNPQAIAGLVGNGELLYRSGRYSEAETRFSTARTADESNLDAKIGVAKTWLALERAKEAKDLLVQVIATDPKDSRAQYWLGRVEESLGHKKEAQAAFEKAISLATKADAGVTAYVGLSHLLASMDKTDEATKKLAEAAEKYPNSAELSKARGDIALSTGKYEDAREQYEQALKKSSDDLQTMFQLGTTLRRMRAYDEAAAVFDKIGKIDKEFPGLALERGLYFEETGQRDQALQMYAEALKKAPNDPDLKLRVGSTQVIAGHPKEAEPILKDVLADRPNSPEANHFYGRAILLNGGNIADAIRYLQKAVDNDPNRAEYHLYVGWAANLSGDAAKAERELAKALALDSSLAEAYWQDGVRLQKVGATRDAMKQLLTALDKRPSLYEAYATLGLCYEDQNDWRSAEESWKRAIAKDDKVADWHYRLGKIYDKKNDTAGAIKEYERALELAATRESAPGWLADTHLHLAEAYKGKDKVKAVEHAEEFLRLAPADSAYRSDAEAIIAQLKGDK